jgi:imidazoleglycerol-phosphate dehydratase
VRVQLGLKGDAGFQTGVATRAPFLDHMLCALARYSGLNLAITAVGDLRHHVIEDVAITLGLALREALPATCRRYGHAVIPMDDALVEAALDAGGRAYYKGRLPSSLYEHFFRSFADNAGLTLHLRVIRGRDRHHVIEAAFKAVGMALGQAVEAGEVVFSTKGAVRVERKQEH